jgi:hypothetical protein
VNDRCEVDGCTKPAGARRKMCRMHRARVERHGDPLFVVNRKGDPSARFWANVAIRDASQCWLYGGTILRTGYGQFTAGRDFRANAHRFAYEDKVGPIPDGLTIDHLCNVRACVNPSHLEPVTNSENSRRRHQRERVAKEAS